MVVHLRADVKAGLGVQDWERPPPPEELLNLGLYPQHPTQITPQKLTTPFRFYKATVRASLPQEETGLPLSVQRLMTGEERTEIDTQIY